MRPATDTTMHRRRTTDEHHEELESTQQGRHAAPEGLVLLVFAVLLLIFALGPSIFR